MTNLIDQAISTYSLQGVFGMAGADWRGFRFRVNRAACYVNDYGTVQIVLQIERNGVWLDFGKETPEAIHLQAYSLDTRGGR